MNIDEFKHSGPPIGEDDIRALEKLLGQKLPAQYRTFLLRQNGGSPQPQEAFCGYGDKDKGSVLGIFYAVVHEDYGCRIEYGLGAFEKRIPSDLLPIGAAAFGDQVCIGLSGKGRGKIFLWMRSDEDPRRWKLRPWRKNIRCIADSFDEFLASFYDLDEGDVAAS